MSERLRALLVICVTAVCAIVSYVFFLKPFIAEQPSVQKVLNAHSTWTVTMQEYLHTGPLSAQTYRISNDDGKVTMFYSATNHGGSITKQFDVPLVGPAGTFLFEELRAQGIWELDDKPLRPNLSDEYIVEVQQTLGDEGGSRAFSFSDPHYWATTKAREFRLSLNPKHTGGDVGARTIGDTGHPLRDDRYLQIVNRIKRFGSQSVLDAENTIRTELASTPKLSRKGQRT
ncbi:MAG: hypothetical protein M3T49_04365 [Candidatus Eremiobacteraeota bacterium]|nr:hypothetical protein [Candidatus Eremiobacteraeota bacterium]